MRGGRKEALPLEIGRQVHLNGMPALVYSYQFADKEGSKKLGVLMASCLLMFQKTGMGCFHWIQQDAQFLLGIRITDVLLNMGMDKFESTNIAAVNLLINHLSKSKKQYSWRWARLFNDGAFQSRGIRSAPLYSAIMMCPHTGATASDKMWEIHSFNIDRMKGLKSEALMIATAL